MFRFAQHDITFSEGQRDIHCPSLPKMGPLSVGDFGYEDKILKIRTKSVILNVVKDLTILRGVKRTTSKKRRAKCTLRFKNYAINRITNINPNTPIRIMEFLFFLARSSQSGSYVQESSVSNALGSLLHSALMRKNIEIPRHIHATMVLDDTVTVSTIW